MRSTTPNEEEEEIEAVLPEPRSRSSTSAVSRRGGESRSSRNARGGSSATPGVQGPITKVPGQKGHIVGAIGNTAPSRSPVTKVDNEAKETSSRDRDGNAGSKDKDDDEEDDLRSVSASSSVIEVPIAGPSESASVPTHGPRRESTDPILADDLFPSSPSSSSSSLPRQRRYRGAPYVDIPLLPLHQVRKYSKPANCRHPTSLSRNEQLQFNQTPPPSSSEDPDVAFVKILSGLPLKSSRAGRKKKGSTWMTRSTSESSADLGGYGSTTSSSDDSQGTEESDMQTRRGTRSRAKGKEAMPKRSVRTGGRVSLHLSSIRGEDLSKDRHSGA